MTRCNDPLHDAIMSVVGVLAVAATLCTGLPTAAAAAPPTESTADMEAPEPEPSSESHADEWGDDAATTVPPPPLATSPTPSPPPAEPPPRKRKRVRGIVMMAAGGGLFGAGWASSILVGGIAAGFGREDGAYMVIPVAGPIVWFTLLGRDHPDVGVLYVLPAFFLGGLQIAGVSVLAAGAAIHVRDKRANAATLGFDVGRPRWALRTRVTRHLSLAPGGLRLSF